MSRTQIDNTQIQIGAVTAASLDSSFLTDGYALIADSTQTSGFKWRTAVPGATGSPNGPNGVVVLDGSGHLPAVDGSALTGLPVTPPGGSSTQLQYNNSGVFAGAAGLTTDGNYLYIFGAMHCDNGTIYSNGIGDLHVHGTISCDNGVIYSDGFGNLNAIELIASSSLSSAGTLAVGSSQQFQVNASGNIIKINNKTTSFISGHAGWVLSDSDGLGTLTWIAPGGGGGSPAGSNFQLQFYNSGAFGASPNLAWDGTNETLLIGAGVAYVPAPLPSVQVLGDGSVSAFLAASFDNTDNGGLYVGLRAGGSVAIPSATPSGQNIVTFLAVGHNGTSFDFSHEGGELAMLANETWSPTAHGTSFSLKLCATGTITTDQVLYASTDSVLGALVSVGNTAPTSMFNIGTSNQFQIDSSGNIVKLFNQACSFPSDTAGTTAGYVLTNNGSGTLTWATSGVSVQNVVSGSRVVGTYYQNTTGKPMFVCITVSGSGAGNANFVSDPNPIPTAVLAQMNNGTQEFNIMCVVLPGNYYGIMVVSGIYNISTWVESY